jgi:hypothetical protein
LRLYFDDDGPGHGRVSGLTELGGVGRDGRECFPINHHEPFIRAARFKMNSFWHEIWMGLKSGGALDQLNLLGGVVGVALMIRRSLWAFPVGMVAVSVQGVLFWQATFYADAKLQLFFFGCLA